MQLGVYRERYKLAPL